MTALMEVLLVLVVVFLVILVLRQPKKDSTKRKGDSNG